MPKEYIHRIEKYLNRLVPLEPIKTNTKPHYYADRSIKSVIFDIYGTLIISASGDLDRSNLTLQGITTAISEGGFDWGKNQDDDNAKMLLALFHDTVQKHHDKLKLQGHPYPEIDIIQVWKEVVEKALDQRLIFSIGVTDLYLLTIVFELLGNAVYPMPHMNQVLNQLFIAKKPIGIVSNAQFYTPILMNYFIHNLLTNDEHIHGFNQDISVYSYKIQRSKPDTFLFETLATSLEQNYQLKPGEVLFVGNDMLKDVWTASQLGFKTALFAGDERSLRLRENDLRTKDLKPDFVITDLVQLFDIVSI